MSKGIILLDIDDCIAVSEQTWVGDTDDSEALLIINCKRIAMICVKLDLKIGILSSLSTDIYFKDKPQGYIQHRHEDNIWLDKELDKGYYKYEKVMMKCINLYLSKYIVSVKDCSKESYIKRYIINKDYKYVFVIDDTDFTHSCNHNNHSHYIYTGGLITNKTIGEIYHIMKGK